MIKNLLANAGDAKDKGLIPGPGRSPGEELGNPFNYLHLENPMDRGVWWATVPGVTKSWTPLSGQTITNDMQHCISLSYTAC